MAVSNTLKLHLCACSVSDEPTHMQQQRNSITYSQQTVWSPGREYQNDLNQGANVYYAAAASPLHPDTLLPMNEKEAGPSKDFRPSHEEDSWQLGLLLGGQGRVQRVVDGTPAHRAKLVFESQVRLPFKNRGQRCIFDHIYGWNRRASGRAKYPQGTVSSVFRENRYPASRTRRTSPAFSHRVRLANAS